MNFSAIIRQVGQVSVVEVSGKLTSFESGALRNSIGRLLKGPRWLATGYDAEQNSQPGNPCGSGYRHRCLAQRFTDRHRGNAGRQHSLHPECYDCASWRQSTELSSLKRLPAAGIGYLSPLAQLNRTTRSSGQIRPSARACL